MPWLRERLARVRSAPELSHGDGNTENDEEYRRNLQRRIKFMYMNPCDKVREKKRFPYKLFLQIIKVFLVTCQMSFFGVTRSSHVDFLEKSTLALKHMYLKHWDPSYETLPYPPATGAYAIYTIPEFYEHVNFAMERYDQTEKLAIGTYHFKRNNHTEPKMWMCKEYYREGKINASTESFEFDARHVKDCFELSTVSKCDHGNCTEQYDIKEYLAQNNKTFNFDRIIRVHLNFTVMTVHLKELSQMSSPDCFKFGVKIWYENQEHNGQMQIELELLETPLNCKGKIIYDVSSEEIILVLNIILDIANILISVASLFLCSRSVYNSLSLLSETRRYCKNTLHIKLTRSDIVEFFHLWYWMIIMNDIFVIVGSVYKILIETVGSTHYEVAAGCLGMANFLVWIGVLRYFTFFRGFNVITITLKSAILRCSSFLLTGFVIYFAYTATGWVILGPFHMKFRYLSSASECLFSLVNGDDMYVTFSIISSIKNKYVWWFSRIYLYSFIALFIYIVLNLFLVIILDAYEVYKLNQKDGVPKTELHKFVDDSPDYSHLLMSKRNHQTCKGNLCCFCQVWCHCCLGEEDESEAMVYESPHARLISINEEV